MDDEQIAPRTDDGLWPSEPRSLQTKVSYLLVFCPASPSSVSYTFKSPGALLLEMGPALGEGGTKWSRRLGVPWSSIRLPVQGCGWGLRLHLWPGCPVMRLLEQVLRLEVFLGPPHLAPVAS